jgi:hypothetical protein
MLTLTASLYRYETHQAATFFFFYKLNLIYSHTPRKISMASTDEKAKINIIIHPDSQE